MSVCLYFHVHQPYRVRRYRVFEVGKNHDYFNDQSDSALNNRKVLAKVAGKSYLPANAVLLHLLKRYPGFKFAFSFSGVILDQMEEFSPDVLRSFKELVRAGGDRVEILGDTYHHSLAFFYSPKEFERQIELHRRKIFNIFGKNPRVLRNTELSYNNDLALWADKRGYLGILAEGWDPVLGWRSPNFVYRPKGTKKISVLLKNYRLSDDIAFRFGEKGWTGWPLTADKFASWVSASHLNGNTVNLFMDYETFGEHQWADTGIFDFLASLPEELFKDRYNKFMTPSETIKSYKPVGEIDVPGVLTWADTERDLSAWTGNHIQKEAIDEIYSLENRILESKNPGLIDDWRRLQTSDHFYYMCTKWFADGDVHKYFNPYETPFDAFISFMSAIEDLKWRLDNQYKTRNEKRSIMNLLSSRIK